MKVLITGAGGRLGQELAGRFASKPYVVLAAGRREMDVADEGRTHAVVGGFRPDVIIHAAAYTDVDRAERERDEAFRVNAVGTRNVAAAAEEVSAKLVYVSTDYVFDGKLARPYNEYDRPSPVNVYGASKLAGEKYAQRLCRRHFIVRTGWLYGLHGDNFVKRIAAAAKLGSPIRAAVDQTGSPTCIRDLTAFIDTLLSTRAYGVYHAVNSGCCTRYQWARAILEHLPYRACKLVPARAEEFRTPAPRPGNSALDALVSRLSGLGVMRPWEEALREFLAENNQRW